MGEILELPLARAFIAREGRIPAKGREGSALPWQSQTSNASRCCVARPSRSSAPTILASEAARSGRIAQDLAAGIDRSAAA